MIAFWPHQQLHMIVDLTCKQEQEGQKDGKKVWLLVCMNTGTERVVMLIQAGRRPTAEMKSLNQEISKSKNHGIKKQHSKTWCESGTATQKVGGEGFLTMAGLWGRTMFHKKDLSTNSPSCAGHGELAWAVLGREQYPWWLQICPGSNPISPKQPPRPLFTLISQFRNLLVKPCPCHYDDCCAELFHGFYEWNNIGCGLPFVLIESFLVQQIFLKLRSKLWSWETFCVSIDPFLLWLQPRLQQIHPIIIACWS